MKTFPLPVLIFTACQALATDGYKKEVALIELQKEPHRTGDVYKIRQFKVEADGLSDGPTVAAVLFVYSRHTGPEIKLTVSAQQWRHLKLAPAVFLRRNAEGWEYLGSKITRDQKGNLIFDY